MRITTKHPVFFLLFTLIVFVLLISSIASYIFYAQPAESRVLGKSAASTRIIKTQAAPTISNFIPPTKIPTPTIKPTSTPKPTLTPTPVTPTPTPTKIYTAEKIGDSTWKVTNVTNDTAMASRQEILSALNAYRTSHGVGALSWDNNLGDFAQSRASTFDTNKGLDGHGGFRDYMNNGGFAKSGFNGLGENSAYLSGPMNADKIIKDIFGADGAHDGNQLDPSWTHAGVGQAGNAVNINFGKNKI